MKLLVLLVASITSELIEIEDSIFRKNFNSDFIPIFLIVGKVEYEFKIKKWKY